MESEATELFINAVKDYPEIYDTKHIHYKNTFARECAWNKIYEVTGVDVKTLKAKWRNLRDTYKKSRHGQNAPSGANAKKYAKWMWADHMSFLDSTYEPKRIDTTSNNLETNAQSTTEEESSNQEAPEQAVEIKTEPKDNEESVPPQQHRKINSIYRKRRRIRKIAPTERIPRNRAENIRPATEAVKVTCDRIDMEFLGYANSVKNLPLRQQAVIKLQITSLITKAQLAVLDGRPNSNDSIASPIFYDQDPLNNI